MVNKPEYEGVKPKKRVPAKPFAKGNPGGPGRPKGSGDKTDAAKLKAAFVAAVTEEDIVAITKTLVMKARNGNPYAAVIVFDRLWGKAPQAITGEDGKSPVEMVVRVDASEAVGIARRILASASEGK